MKHIQKTTIFLFILILSGCAIYPKTQETEVSNCWTLCQNIESPCKCVIGRYKVDQVICDCDCKCESKIWNSPKV